MLTIRNYADPKVWQPPTAPSAPTGPRGPTGNVPTAPVPGAQPPAGVPHVPVGVPPQSQERAEGVVSHLFCPQTEPKQADLSPRVDSD